ncbi:hypothetical protein NE865_15687 [Phthorimaea operculella]|nr:hypothetical protein NE865_15687 [Phthorimaea operculella]
MDTSFLADDVLAFLQDHLTITNEASAIQLCSTYFSVDDICKAKALLCEWLKLNAKCVPHRTGDENGKKSLKDIMNILKETKFPKVPVFVRATHKKLPNALDQQDVTRLLRDVRTLEAKLEEFQRKFERSEKTIPADKGKRRRRNNENRPPKPLAASAANNKGMVKLPLFEPTLNKRSDQVDADGFTLVQKKRRRQPRQNKCGTAPVEANLPLRAFTPRTSLYVSRLHDTTTKQDVLDYIFARHKAGVFKDTPRLGVYVEPLESRHWVDFNSFVVRVPTATLSVFTSPEFWPQGVVFRRFRGKLPLTSPP